MLERERVTQKKASRNIWGTKRLQAKHEQTATYNKPTKIGYQIEVKSSKEAFRLKWCSSSQNKVK